MTRVAAAAYSQPPTDKNNHIPGRPRDSNDESHEGGVALPAIQHELVPRLSVSGSWFKGNFHNLTTTINQNWSLADYTPYTFYNPLTDSRSRSLPAALPRRSVRRATSTPSIPNVSRSTKR
jgi:hypothetical protein